MITQEMVAAIRKEYTLDIFDEAKVLSNPFDQFAKWFNEAIEAQVNEPNAFSLATTHYNGRPASRIVLLKGFTEKGFVFYTNYNSNKGRQLRSNPYAAMVFFWPELQRQVRIEGMVEKASENESDSYFASRPYESKLGAHVSEQSTPITSREVLQKKYDEIKTMFASQEMVRPQHWGGLVIVPNLFEFWQGRESRLHDRFQFQLKNKVWERNRLSP